MNRRLFNREASVLVLFGSFGQPLIAMAGDQVSPAEKRAAALTSDAYVKVYLRNGGSRPAKFEVIDLTSGETIQSPLLDGGEQFEVQLATGDGRLARLQYRRQGTITWTTAYSLRKYDTVTMR